MPSMKVPPKRKGNSADGLQNILLETLNESPSEKEGKFRGLSFRLLPNGPSMKVPPKRKGNLNVNRRGNTGLLTLNESPSEKEGKFRVYVSGWGYTF